MKATLLIDGREAVPVRAIPFITGWRLSPDALVKDLARHEHRRKYNDYLPAFQFDPVNAHPEILPAEWDQVLAQLNALENRLDLGFAQDAELIAYSEWREQSPSVLPKGCFVWRDEFDVAMKRGRLSAALREHETELSWNYFPLVSEGMAAIIMEGFDATLGHVASPDGEHAIIERAKWPWGTYETTLLRALADAAERFWVNFDPTDSTTAPRNEEVIAWLDRRGVSVNVAKAMATILRPDGLPTGPRK